MRLDLPPVIDTEAGTTTSSEPPSVEDLIIKEARRRHRRRLLLVSGVAVVVSLLGFEIANIWGGSPHRSHGRTVSTRPSARPATLTSCSVGQLMATVVFNQSRTDLGAIKLTNMAAHPCSLSGRPRVTIIDGLGGPLDLHQSPFQRAGLPPPPRQPIVLSANRSLPQAIVELDLTWCGKPPGAVQFGVQFSNWRETLTVPNSAISPAGFVPADCTDSGLSPLLAVDDVRALGQDGVVTAGS